MLINYIARPIDSSKQLNIIRIFTIVTSAMCKRVDKVYTFH